MKGSLDDACGGGEAFDEARSSPVTQPFAALTFAAPTGLRAAIAAAHRRPEPECIAALIDVAAATPQEAPAVRSVAESLVRTLREKSRSRTGGVEGLIQEYSLSSQEGVALMCLAEALLRIPDSATRDALIRDKLAGGDWRAHLGQSPSMFVNAATWGLMLTGKLVSTNSERSLSAALSRLIARSGEPLIRAGVDVAMRLMGEQFVTGRTIEEALKTARVREAQGFRYSYDMLGEAATTAQDATRYYADYERAIHAIGRAAEGRGPYEGPGISIKLSALHPRYARAKLARVSAELLPCARRLAALARSYDIGFNIDAEESERLDLSLDILEALALDPELAGWDGLGFVIQAYGKRCPYVIDALVDLGRRAGRRLMVRLVKGAYWDSEIKRAQLDGLSDFPVYTRKVHTDVSYLACARKLLAAPDAIYPQFATHNAQTLASVMAFAGPHYTSGQYEFQCLHGMGEPLYEEVVGHNKLNRPCRVYAPVGSHETLLAYLVRRLLENGANTSFVNRIADESVPVAELIADPTEAARAGQPLGAPHERIALPPALYGAERRNSLGLDLASDLELARLAAGLAQSFAPQGEGTPILNPADLSDEVGRASFADKAEVDAALAAAEAAAVGWAAPGAAERGACLKRAADLFETHIDRLIGLAVREAGKTYANAVGEVREAVDFLRYYAVEAEKFSQAAPLGVVACISPWNFPLAIFTGQVAAALAVGNVVLAKPAEETPLIAAEAVRLLHEAGVARVALRLLAGAGDVGAALVGDARVQGVIFTGSTPVAALIARQLAGRLTSAGQPVPLIAETGGLNAMIVDSSALAEQVVGDVIASAFDSAGQRCSALRLLCLQEDVAERTLEMLRGAMAELEVGDPRRLSVDVGPVISGEAQANILGHIEGLRLRFPVTQTALGPDCARGTFVAPTLIEIGVVADLEREVFGPVLHVLRYKRADLDKLVDAINATGFGLTFGLHTRLDETIARVVGRIEAGNIYVNRNIIGATVGVQPFGGSRLSGTGPKAGGPLYLARLVADPPKVWPEGEPDPALRLYADALAAQGFAGEAERASALRSPLGARLELAGPVGERNVYVLKPRGLIAALAETEAGLRAQISAILAAGDDAAVARLPLRLPAALSHRVRAFADPLNAPHLAGALIEGEGEAVTQAARRLAARPGPILRLQALSAAALAAGEDYDLAGLVEERVVSTNIAAAGGNASLMTIG
jgi:RHH-type proline utilization regulon transcriptional repressor/proline dehydrogenase/delta 1-pyrroline-5-carboxylate dehydrogenase